MEGYREGARAEIPKGPLWRENSTGTVLVFLRSTRARCISNRRELPEERDECEVTGSGDEVEEGGPGPPDV